MLAWRIVVISVWVMCLRVSLYSMNLHLGVVIFSVCSDMDVDGDDGNALRISTASLNG